MSLTMEESRSLEDLSCSHGMGTCEQELIKFRNISHLLFDADDTLWDDQGKLQEAERSMEQMLNNHLGRSSGFQERFIAVEHSNIPRIGFGFHSYLFSMAQTLFENAEYAGAQQKALPIIDALIKDFLAAPPRVLPEAAETLQLLRSRGYTLAVATRGVPGEQQEKLRKSGLAELFHHVFVVPSKEPATYLELAARLGVSPDACCMVGNSLRSDINPALGAGLFAVHIPEPNAWSYDAGSFARSDKALRLQSLAGLQEMFQICRARQQV